MVSSFGKRGDEDQQHQIIDFKMVTFTLGGKDYGIDIMQVKEIYKAEHFTPVPNTAPFVKGVFNLRGEIISIVDLRKMFHMQVIEKVTGETEDIIFLKSDDHLTGIVVDFINDVVGVDSSTIQPPHPLFGDINIKYISGVVEFEEKLFIVLDIDTILGAEDSGFGAVQAPVQSLDAQPVEPISPENLESPMELGYTFVTETLATLASFYVSEINENWVRSRFSEWQTLKGPESADIQLKSPDDAQQFLQGFQSANTGTFWSESMSSFYRSILPEAKTNVLSLWNIGCGAGYETLSLACLLRLQYPDKQIKIWAHDSDLISVSNAPNLVVGAKDLPEWLRSFTQEGNCGIIFKKEITDLILFEYHDALHDSPLPPVNFIVARDLLSYLQPDGKQKILADYKEKLVPGGVLIIGDNERILDDAFSENEKAGFKWYVKV